MQDEIKEILIKYLNKRDNLNYHKTKNKWEFRYWFLLDSIIKDMERLIDLDKE